MADRDARVQRLGELTVQDLLQSRNALFIVSTFGDGEAPDSARGFERKLLGRPLALEMLNYAVLALGDRQYALRFSRTGPWRVAST